MTDTIQLRYRIGDDGVERVVSGRFAWTLDALVIAGEKGVTPIERPAPRWSHYVDILRDREGLAIVTLEEKHGGPFKGWHGRYILKSPVQVIERVAR